jgi:VTC domain
VAGRQPQSSERADAAAFVDELVDSLDPVSLEELDERAALRERVDTKYVADRGRVADTVGRLSGAYRVLEIDSRRSFDYESVYFDTPDLRCFREHVEDRVPRFKARSRYYLETDACFLEVKVKRNGTTKRQRPYDHAHHGELTAAGRRFLDEALTELADQQAPADLAPTLSTGYRRVTLGAREVAERVTLDFDVKLRAMDNRRLTLRDDLVLIETKTERGDSAFDDDLRAAGCHPTSISKYRFGVGLLLADDPGGAGREALRRFFS